MRVSGFTAARAQGVAGPAIQSSYWLEGDLGCRHLTSTSRFTAGYLPIVNLSIVTSHRFLVLAVAVLFVLGTWFHGFQAPERAVYALASKALPTADVSSAIAVVAIDNAAIKGIGSWPWPRDRIAATIDRLRRFGVRAVGVTLPLADSQTPPALAGLVYEATKSGRRKLSGTLEKWATRLDSDADLARAVGRQGRVVLGAGYTQAESAASGFSTLKPAAVEEPAFFSFLIAPPAAPDLAVQAPLESLADAAAGVGVIPDSRAEATMYALPLAVRDGDKAYPGFITLLTALARRIPPAGITVMPDKGVRIGKKTMIVAPDLAYRPLSTASGEKDERVPIISVARLCAAPAASSCPPSTGQRTRWRVCSNTATCTCRWRSTVCSAPSSCCWPSRWR